MTQEEHKPAWTEEEISKFESLCEDTSSPSQVVRISGRLGMSKFVKLHGNEKCDAMYSILREKWNAADAKKKRRRK